MYVIAGLVGFAAGFMAWFITAPWVASSILWVEHRYPQIIGTKTSKASEVIICGMQVLACLALAIWIARLIMG